MEFRRVLFRSVVERFRRHGFVPGAGHELGDFFRYVHRKSSIRKLEAMRWMGAVSMRICWSENAVGPGYYFRARHAVPLRLKNTKRFLASAWILRLSS